LKGEEEGAAAVGDFGGLCEVEGAGEFSLEVVAGIGRSVSLEGGGQVELVELEFEFVARGGAVEEDVGLASESALAALSTDVVELEAVLVRVVEDLGGKVVKGAVHEVEGVGVELGVEFEVVFGGQVAGVALEGEVDVLGGEWPLELCMFGPGGAFDVPGLGGAAGGIGGELEVEAGVA